MVRLTSQTHYMHVCTQTHRHAQTHIERIFKSVNESIYMIFAFNKYNVINQMSLHIFEACKTLFVKGNVVIREKKTSIYYVK